jgi:hypothetical protein
MHKLHQQILHERVELNGVKLVVSCVSMLATFRYTHHTSSAAANLVLKRCSRFALVDNEHTMQVGREHADHQPRREAHRALRNEWITTKMDATTATFTTFNNSGSRVP